MEQLCLSEDLIRLRNEGVVFSLAGGRYLNVDGVPYLNQQKELKSGTLVMKLVTSGTTIQPPENHTAYWIGEHPADTDGSLITGLVKEPCNVSFDNGMRASFFLSCKQIGPDGRYIPYLNYYDKVMKHLTIISAPAKRLFPDDCAKMTKPVIIQEKESPFVYGDTNSSRASITGISKRLENQKVAIIGLGGTGAYLLDYLAKCPVKEIHLFDDDYFDTHNAFRCPGAASVEELSARPRKVQYLHAIYSHMHKGIVPHYERVSVENMNVLDNMDFVFISVDSVAARCAIVNHLIDLDKPFIDSGLGFEINQNRIVGQVRVTTGFFGNFGHLRDAIGSQEIDDDLYRSNIQIAELNALAAILSILKWKRMLEFYGDTTSADDLNIAYAVADNTIIHSSHLGQQENEKQED